MTRKRLLTARDEEHRTHRKVKKWPASAVGAGRWSEVD
jgi:hypothetical protein